MRNGYKCLIVMGLLAMVGGCAKDYKTQRPPIDQLDPNGGSNLQSKDLVQITDAMAQDLLALPALNDSDKQWTIVATYMQNETNRPRAYDIFIDRLKTNLSKYGQGRVTLIENKARFYDLQSRELDHPAAPGQEPNRTQPDYFLYGKMQALPGSGTITYRAEFNLTNSKTGVQVWSRDYLVKVGK